MSSAPAVCARRAGHACRAELASLKRARSRDAASSLIFARRPRPCHRTLAKSLRLVNHSARTEPHKARARGDSASKNLSPGNLASDEKCTLPITWLQSMMAGRRCWQFVAARIDDVYTFPSMSASIGVPRSSGASRGNRSPAVKRAGHRRLRDAVVGPNRGKVPISSWPRRLRS